MACELELTIGFDCDVKTAGGMSQKVWAFNAQDLSDQDAFIAALNDDDAAVSTIPLIGYATLFGLETAPQGFTAGASGLPDSTERVQLWNHTLTGRFYPAGVSSDKAIVQLTTAVGIIFVIETKGKEFYIVGGEGNGFATVYEKNTGASVADDPAVQITFVAKEQGRPLKRFIVGSGYADTKAYLEGLE
jgi:hypothetical protein